MTISVVCPNGHQLNAKDELAGRTLPCPKCGEPVHVEDLEVLDDLVEVEEEDPFAAAQAIDPLNEIDPLVDMSSDSDPLADPLTGPDPLTSSLDDPLAGGPLADPLHNEQFGGAHMALPTTPAPSQHAQTTSTGVDGQPTAALWSAVVGAGAITGLCVVGWFTTVLFGQPDEVALADARRAAEAPRRYGHSEQSMARMSANAFRSPTMQWDPQLRRW